MTTDPGWQVTPHPVDGDVAEIVKAAAEQERRQWQLADHLDDRTHAQLMELARNVI